MRAVLELTIDGHRCETPDGSTILDACRLAGITVPTLCHDDRLVPSGACRICLVEVEGDAHPVAACAAPAAPGMVVHTASDRMESVREGLLRLLAEEYPASALDAVPDAPFHRLLRDYGLDGVPARAPDPALSDDSHPCIHIDLSQCISCWRCVRICAEVQGQDVWKIVGRGAQSRVAPELGTLAQSSCVSCGACVDTCPTGALADRTVLELGSPTRHTRTTCPYCGVGCELLVGTRDGRITSVEPAQDAPVNRGHLCVKGRYAHGFVTAPDRVTHPMVREHGSWHAVTWEEAIATVAGRLRLAVERHGTGAVGLLGSARATNEDNYVLQKLARVVLGTNNVDCCARVCHAPSAAALREMLGTGAATSSYADIERARTILVVGTNTTANHPVVGARIKQAARAGATLIVIDPRRVELAEMADAHLQLHPGTNVLVLDALAATIVEEGLIDEEFVRDRVDDLAAFEEHVRRHSPELVADACGVDAELIRRAARPYATGGPAISFHGLGVTEHTQGTESVMALANLALLTGNLGRPGTGINPLRGQNNVQGSAHMGCEPRHLPGYTPIESAPATVEPVWGVTVPRTRGLDAMEMIDAAGEGSLRALWAMGWDVLLTQPNMAATRRGLERLDLLVVQDLFLNETARELATVFLPAASAFEHDGTFMNGERRVQRVRAALDPPGSAKPDWEIVCLVARALGHADGFTFRSAEQIWEEIRRVWSPGAGMAYARLEQPGGLQWPCPAEDHPGTSLLHTEQFPGIGPRARLRAIEHVPTPERTDAGHPLTLVTGRDLYQFNAGTMTRRSLTQHLRPTDTLEIAPADAVRLGITDGTRVRVKSRYGEAMLPARLTERVAPGEVFATFSDPAVGLNRVTGPHRDPVTHTPEYKVTAVRVEPADRGEVH